MAITYSAGMKKLPIALGIAIVSLKGLSVLPVAVGLVFQMLGAVSFYQFFRRKQARSEGSGQGIEPSKAR